MEICLEPGFDWIESVGKKMPDCPEWCQVTHFGFLRQGKMIVHHQDGSAPQEINAGDSYYVGPGHRPEIPEGDPAIMVEFSQDPTVQKTLDVLK